MSTFACSGLSLPPEDQLFCEVDCKNRMINPLNSINRMIIYLNDEYKEEKISVCIATLARWSLWFFVLLSRSIYKEKSGQMIAYIAINKIMKFPATIFCSFLFFSCDSNRPASYEYDDTTSVRKHTQVNPRDSSGGLKDSLYRDTAAYRADSTNQRQPDRDSIQWGFSTTIYLSVESLLQRVLPANTSEGEARGQLLV